MRLTIYFLSLFFLMTLALESNAQFWKKKEYHTNATSGKITEPDGDIYRDAFIRKSHKGPNVKTKRKPIFRTKKSMHKHATSRKTKKAGSQRFFKPKYSKARMDKKSKDTFSRNARKTKKDAQKGGGGSKGIFKGRKK